MDSLVGSVLVRTTRFGTNRHAFYLTATGSDNLVMAGRMGRTIVSGNEDDGWARASPTIHAPQPERIRFFRRFDSEGRLHHFVGDGRDARIYDGEPLYFGPG